MNSKGKLTDYRPLITDHCYMKRLPVFLPLLLMCLLGVAPAFAQSKPETIYPFKVGEELSYEGELSKLLLRGVNVVDLRFAVRQGPAIMPDAAVAQPSFQFVADAESKGALLKIFRQSFRQHIESTADAATMAALATKKNDVQNKRERTSQAVFDYRAGVVTWTEQNLRDLNAAPRVVSSPLAGTAYDLASVWYYLRLQKTLTAGTTFSVPISDAGRVYRIPVHVRERKTMKTLLGKVAVVRLEPEVFGSDRLIGGKGRLSVWLTDDARRIPVRGEISSDLGKLTITLKQAKL